MLPEAVSKGYFRSFSNTHNVQKYVPFKERRAILRHFVIGTVMACIWVPISIFLLSYVGQLNGIAMALYNGAYIAILTFVSYPFAFIGFASERSVSHLLRSMDNESPFLQRMIHRLWMCPQC